MRWRNSLPAALLVAASAVALWPAVAQRSPESILPPGFGEPEPANSARPAPERPQRPTTDLVPDVRLNVPGAPAQTGTPTDVIGDLIEDTSNNSTAVVTAPMDLPPQARRSLDRVGVADADETGFALNAYASTDGRFLGTMMQRMNAPIASRWLSILLRRSLLSQSDIPPGIGGADWVAERAWLLLRMGEADMARALVARVDAENFTPKLYAVAMQAALATGDPASLCPIANAAASVSDEPSWPLAQAMCAGLSGESGTASALVDKVRDAGDARGIDVLLAEKVVGAATNTRRSVSIQWDGVDKLTSWRFGLATATGVAIPPKLFATVGPQVQAWQARAPLAAPAARVAFAERAAAMGVFSSEALVDFFGTVWDATDPAERGSSVGETLRAAYSGDESARLGAMRTLWSATGADPYARQVLTARAAAMLSPGSGASGDDLDRAVGSMLSAGLDIQAARWGSAAQRGSLAWALLAVGAPRAIQGLDASAVRAIDGGEEDRRAKFMLAALAGLGRISADDASSLAESYAVPLGRQTKWTQALDRAAKSGQAGTVVLIAAAGMQTREWQYVPPESLYHIVVAFRRVGLEPEARMIAAEALTRA
ncbi:hypothetical protein [Sphingomonas sp. SUN039]|uniref:hypothetical protein n=1 Tax=Sphingomonas sp. SUN039 TaxID=2937787 RepID=UPI0021640CB2|nr:hypothetical protein [Sphingomonas sp. SUN039]UVO53455.1 hypothetical protein M0209_04715 [Sphingomonas sp. SUN039]